MHFFYKPDLESSTTLDGDEFHHCTRVLRHQEGDTIHLSNGMGAVAAVEINKILKRDLQFSILHQETFAPRSFRVHLIICPTKNFDRMEWMVEKAAEIRVDEISFMTSINSERPKLNLARLEKKVVSALKQSKGAWKTKLNAIRPFEKIIEHLQGDSFIAYVEEKSTSLGKVIMPSASINILIGPEGDFTPEEIIKGKSKGISPVSLGQSVLRTETAGLLACHTVNVVNDY